MIRKLATAASYVIGVGVVFGYLAFEQFKKVTA